jgi:hypothetical protein
MRIIRKLKTRVPPLILFGLLAAACVFAQTDEQKKSAADEFVSRADKIFEKSKKVFTVKEQRKGKKFLIEESNYGVKNGEVLTRKFSYSMDGKDVETLIINYQTGKFSAEETYYFKNGRLVYAAERHFLETDGKTNSVWSGVFYFENEKLFHENTNGHGKSEADDWSAEKEILQMSRTRLEQLNKYLAQKK